MMVATHAWWGFAQGGRPLTAEVACLVGAVGGLGCFESRTAVDAEGEQAPLSAAGNTARDLAGSADAAVGGAPAASPGADSAVADDAGGPRVGADAAVSGEFVSLFDGHSLAGWNVHRGDGEGVDADEIFTVDDVGIHVYAGAVDGSEQPTATLMTEREYGRFVLEFEYRWGTKRFGERADTARDAGVLFHVHTDLATVWPPSLEMQMGTSDLDGRWVTGDIFILGGTTQAVVGGVVANEGRFRTTLLAENPEGQWNQLRLTVDGASSATYELNGLELNHLESFKRQQAGTYVALDRGRLALQAEYAELWYRGVRIREL